VCAGGDGDFWAEGMTPTSRNREKWAIPPSFFVCMIPVQDNDGSVTFCVRVHPRARKDAITGEVGDALKISLAAPPLDGRANEACIEFLAKLLKLPRSSISIAAGLSSRNKVIRVVGLSAQDVRLRLGI